MPAAHSRLTLRLQTTAHMLVLLLLALGFAISLVQHFVLTLPTQTRSAPEADGIIVLTGGQARLDAGLELLSQSRISDLLLTGVGAGITKPIIAQSYRLSSTDMANLNCCIELEFAAKDTKGNARAARRWIDEKAHGSIILVTAHYHMPRALLEFKQALPDITIIPHPVIPPDLRKSAWFGSWQTWRLLTREYLKYQWRRASLLITAGI